MNKYIIDCQRISSFFKTKNHNTLMSFKDDLTEQEITNFTNELAESLKKDGFSAVYEMQ